MATPEGNPRVQPLPLQASPLAQATIDRLEGVLALLVDHHVRMIEHAQQHRSAISRADARAMAQCVAQQHADAARFGELEALRAEIFRAAMPRPAVSPAPQSARGARNAPPAPLPPPPEIPANVSSLIARATGPARARLNSLVSRLRALVDQLEQQRRVIRVATESLLGHMNGLIAQVGRALSPTGTYSRPNAPSPQSQVLSGLDLTT